MNTLILNAESLNVSIEHLLRQAQEGGVEVRDTSGKLLAFVLSPTDREAWTYAEANLDIEANMEAVRQAMTRRGGVTTRELLAKAAAAEEATRQ